MSTKALLLSIYYIDCTVFNRFSIFILVVVCILCCVRTAVEMSSPWTPLRFQPWWFFTHATPQSGLLFKEFDQNQHSMYSAGLTWALYHPSPSTATIPVCSTPPACILIMYAVTAGVLQIRVFLIRLPPENLNPGTLWATVLSSNCKFITTTTALSIQSMHV